MVELLAGGLLLLGATVFLVGSIGLLRLPDIYCRLHALTKVDNLGLGLIVAGLVLQQSDPRVAIKIIIVWLLLLVSSAAVAHLIARQALQRESE
ncbi:MAG: multicomponent Na+:H+ antiporter subunit G [Motiliproteus sp.]|jgi:multicomponent Na+:H+ antiporter subunit G